MTSWMTKPAIIKARCYQQRKIPSGETGQDRMMALVASCHAESHGKE
jgi:hypothetical protein